MEEFDFVQKFLDDPADHWLDFAERYGGAIKALVYGFGFRANDAQDALQEVFYEIFRRDLARIRHWDPQKGSFTTFLKVVVSRILLDLRRSPKLRQQAHIQYNESETDGNPSLEHSAQTADARSYASDEEIFHILQQYLEQLIQSSKADTMDAVIFHCRYFELPGAVASRLTGLSENAVNIRFHRLKKQIKSFLDAKGLKCF